MDKIIGWLLLIFLVLVGGLGFAWWIINGGWIFFVACFGMLGAVLFMFLSVVAINLISS